MVKKYNIALLPLLKNNAFIYLANEFSLVADKYILGNNSLSHVTLYQFESMENNIENIWCKVSGQWNKQHISLKFAKFSYVTFDKKIYWISLLPEEQNILHHMHKLVANILQLPPKIHYDPHLTLINTKNANYQEKLDIISKSFIPIIDSFCLALGESDEIGQFIKVIYDNI